MILKNNIIFFLIIILTIGSCYKDKSIIDQTILISKDHPPISISANIVGSVQDEFGNELSDFTSTLMNKNYHSYHISFYHFEVHDANKNGTPLKITK